MPYYAMEIKAEAAPARAGAGHAKPHFLVPLVATDI